MPELEDKVRLVSKPAPARIIPVPEGDRRLIDEWFDQSSGVFDPALGRELTNREFSAL